MPYRVIDKKTQTSGDHWTLYATYMNFEYGLVPCIDIEPTELMEVLDNLNPGILTPDDKISIANTLSSSVKEFNTDEQSLTRTRVFEDEAMYNKYISFLSGINLESVYPSHYPLKYTEEIISAGEI